MSSDYDATEFVDSDFQATHKAAYTAPVSAPVNPPASVSNRAPSREEVDAKVGETQQKLAELKRAQEELERERASLEEARRRHIEYQTGRAEMIQNLTRGIGLLEEAEFSARRDAEQMSKSLADMRLVLSKVEATHEEGWTRENFPVELTRGLTTIENARMEWNSARMKFAVLSAATQNPNLTQTENKPAANMLSERSFGELCKLGFALTWPVALVAFLIFLAVLLRH